MGQRVKLRLNQGEPTVLRLEEESDRDVACHPYYLTYMENSFIGWEKFEISRLGEGLLISSDL